LTLCVSMHGYVLLTYACSCSAASSLQDLLELSLSAPGRVTLPRAPPHSLLLYGSQFSPFPTGWGLDTPLVSKYTGDRLSLREGGQQLREEFRQKVR
jgi:tRNA pseudouridine38-40 synthase